MKFIDASTIIKIKSFKNRNFTRQFSGVLEGGHLSDTSSAQSQEFTEYKQYVPGNDTRFIDWKVYAKKEKLFIKRYLQEKALKHNFIIDASGSMAFKGANSSFNKWEYSARLLMAFACHTLIKNDPCSLWGLSSVNNEKTEFSNHLHQLIAFDNLLSEIKPQGISLPPSKLKNYLRGLDNNSAIVLFSDLMLDYPQLDEVIRLMTSKKIKITVFHIIDALEKELPWRGQISVKDMETLKEISLSGESIRREYKKEFDKWLMYCRKSFSVKKIPYFCCYSDMPLEKAIEKYILS
ncbi:MAG: DUF58 domain-containing protein [Elusimicrobiales bacterium]|nr:DUF58 domain-containing protein [Elusimicrobiales bacterium]